MDVLSIVNNFNSLDVLKKLAIIKQATIWKYT